MSHHSCTGSFFKGMGLGVLVGMAAAIAGKCVVCNNHKISKGSGKVVRAIGDFVEGIQTMVK